MFVNEKPCRRAAVLGWVAVLVVSMVCPTFGKTEELATGQFDGFYKGSTDRETVCHGRDRMVRSNGWRLEGYVKGGEFYSIQQTSGALVSAKVFSDGRVEGRSYLRRHSDGTKYTHYDGQITGEEMRMHIRQALADKQGALCDYGELTLLKTDPPKEPTASEKFKTRMLFWNEQFNNALFRFSSKGLCNGRDGKDAVRFADDLMVEYRGSRENNPELSKIVLIEALGKYLKVGDVSIKMKCKEFAADQFRRVRRVVRRLDLPIYRDRANEGLKLLGME